MLKILPPIAFPITASSIDPLMSSLVQLNKLDAGLPESTQNGLAIFLHVFDLYVKSGGKIDYRSSAGLERLKGDAMRFAPSQIVTRHGDLTAAHLSVDWSDTAIRATQVGLPLPSSDVNQLLHDSREFLGMTIQLERQIGCFLDYAGKKTL